MGAVGLAVVFCVYCVGKDRRMFTLENLENIVRDELYYSIGLILISVCSFGTGMLLGTVYTALA